MPCAKGMENEEDFKMYVLKTIFVIMTVLFFLFGKVKMHGIICHNLLTKLILSAVAGVIFALIIGLPIVGIMSLLGF